MQSDMPSVVRVYRARDAMQAYALRNLLADQGIEARVVGSAAADTAGNGLKPEVLVAHGDADRARHLLRSWEQRASTGSTLRSPGSFQFGLWAAIVNSAVLSLVVSMAIVIGNDGNMVIAMLTMVVVGNLVYIALYRRSKQRFVDER